MNKKSFFIAIILASFIGAIVALAAYKIFIIEDSSYNSFEERQNAKFSNYTLENAPVSDGINFVEAAEIVTPGVVHIKVSIESSTQQYRNPFEELFGAPRRGPQQGAGSGVIISDDGYIVTNFHVVDGATKIRVILNDNREYDAEVIGQDPSTDLALIKIGEKNLPFVRYGDSDIVKVGEWVLAVGNPFELTSTVTAGIVSAKGRSINILRRRDLGIESFIQTDAVVNPGNSGGALVNLKGELVGINTAIASPTGSYAGYSFAVPVSLVKKVMDDLLEFGAVQRALLGISIIDVSDAAEEYNLEENSGVYVAGVNIGSSAEDAGLEKGDIIIGIDDNNVKNVAELQENVARNRPGDKIDVTFIRDGKEQKVSATLKNIIGEERMYRREAAMEIQGATIEEVNDDLKEKLDIKGGVQLNNIKQGKWAESGIENGFVITSVDKREINTINDLMASLANSNGGILIGGIYPDGEEAYYGIKWQ